MRIPLYQVDAFTEKVFGGNSAAICLLDDWPADEILQKIAMENNLSETAFMVPEEGDYHLRWFTPEVEVELCGHATLASGFIILSEAEPERDDVIFRTKSGMLTVRRGGVGVYTMSLPQWEIEPATLPSEILDALGEEPEEYYEVRDYTYAVLNNEAALRALKPDFQKLRKIEKVVTLMAPGDSHDFVLRFFAGYYGIDEDPVTGSAQCGAAPYWAKRLEKTKLISYQASRRGGEITTEIMEDHLDISGACSLYLEGAIYI